MSKKLRSIVYEHSSGHLVATAATEEQLGRIKDILCEPRTEACNAAGRQLYEPEPLPMASTHDGLGYKFLRDCLKPNEHPIITGCNRLDYVPVEGIRIPKEPEPQPAKEPIANCDNCKHVCTKSNIEYCHMYEPKPKPVKEQFEVGDCRIEFVKQELHNLLDKI
jgi:hypothetical protein